jgi:GxxExxY protein
MLHEEITEKILAACFEVANELGVGFLESVYEKALLVALRQKGLKAEEQYPVGSIFEESQLASFLPTCSSKKK